MQYGLRLIFSSLDHIFTDTAPLLFHDYWLNTQVPIVYLLEEPRILKYLSLNWVLWVPNNQRSDNQVEYIPGF